VSLSLPADDSGCRSFPMTEKYIYLFLDRRTTDR
jgi:hypothetical protein